MAFWFSNIKSGKMIFSLSIMDKPYKNQQILMDIKEIARKVKEMAARPPPSYDPWSSLRTSTHHIVDPHMTDEDLVVYNNYPRSDRLTQTIVQDLLSGMTDREIAELIRHLNNNSDTLQNITWTSYLLLDDRDIWTVEQNIGIIPVLVVEGVTGGVRYVFPYRRLVPAHDPIHMNQLLGNPGHDRIYNSISWYLLPSPTDIYYDVYEQDHHNLHRDNGPAYIKWNYDVIPAGISKHWFRHGVEVREETNANGVL